MLLSDKEVFLDYVAGGFGTSFHLHDWLEELTRNLKKGTYPFPRVGSNLGNLIIAGTSLIRYEPYNVLLK